MATILTSKLVQAHKRHQCYYCLRFIEVDEVYEYRTGESYGDFWTMHAHPECDAYANKNWDEGDWECHDPGDFPMLDLNHVKNKADLTAARSGERK